MIAPTNLRIGHEATWTSGERARVVRVDRARGWYKIRHYTTSDREFPTGSYGYIKAGEFYPALWFFHTKEGGA